MPLAPLPSRALIAVTGEGWRAFLQGLISQDVETLRPGELRYGAFLTPQGRLVNDLFISGGDDGGVLEVAAAAREAFIARLKLYRLRAKVGIEAMDTPVFAAWGDGAVLTEGWLADPRLEALGFRGYGGAAGEGAATDEGTYHAHRMALGVPDPALDGAESDYPIEANLDLLHGIDFKKGCFVGQETTSRMHRRGMVKTRMAPVRFTGPPPPFGAVILSRERRAGEMRAGADGRGMALMRTDRAGGPLSVDGRPVALELPAWLGRSFDAAVDEKSQS